MIKAESNVLFDKQYDLYCKHLRLKGLQPATQRAYSDAIRRIGAYFRYQLDDLTSDQLTDYFIHRLDGHSWSAVKHDLYALRFYYKHILCKPWVAPDLVRPPKVQRLPDILSQDEVRRLILGTRIMSYRVFFFTLYSLGLRIGEGLRLRVGDIDSAHRRVHIRDAKGNKDRFVPLPQATLHALRGFWQIHRHADLLFPSRAQGLEQARHATAPLDRSGVAQALRLVVAEIGLKKRSPRIACAIPTPPI